MGPPARPRRPVGGTLLIDRVNVTVSRAALEQAEDGLSVRDCVNVRFGAQPSGRIWMSV